jgi:aspartyl/asparaginyl beta-hydroxylase (cupin superfamily)
MQDTPALIARADAAMMQRDYTQARTLLTQATQGADATPDLWLKLAAVCRANKDTLAALKAVDAALQREPLYYVALLMRGSLLEARGDAMAGEAYGHALAQLPDDPPAQYAPVIAQARAVYARHQAHMAERLHAKLAPLAHKLTADEQARFARLQSNALHTTKVYHSEPHGYHYPGLREQEYHERALFPWLERLEAATEIIAQEFQALMRAERREMVPYVQYAAHEPVRQWKALNHNADWSALHLLQHGKPVPANAQYCPQTLALLQSIPQPHIAGASPNAMFSLLAPHTVIPPHTGITNTRLVCHLPLIIPDGCWFRVGAQTRPWQRGTAWVFDDTIEHEAANASDTLRVILIIDVWHPDLSAGEREAVAAFIQAHGAATDAGL